MELTSRDWSASGWADHDIFHLETGRRMSFRARLEWLVEADKQVRFLAGKRRWIDKDGVIHEPTELLAEAPVVYRAATDVASGDTEQSVRR